MRDTLETQPSETRARILASNSHRRTSDPGGGAREPLGLCLAVTPAPCRLPAPPLAIRTQAAKGLPPVSLPGRCWVRQQPPEQLWSLPIRMERSSKGC